MIIRINQKNCIQLENVSYTDIVFHKPKGGGSEFPVHTVYLIGGKSFAVSFQDAIEILFPENNNHIHQEQVTNAQTQKPPLQLGGQVIPLQNAAAPTYAEDINAPEEYVVLKTFNAANDPTLQILAGTPLKKGIVNGLTKWKSDKDPRIIFDYHALQNAEYFGIPGASTNPTTDIIEIPTPPVEKKPG